MTILPNTIKSLTFGIVFVLLAKAIFAILKYFVPTFVVGYPLTTAFLSAFAAALSAHVASKAVPKDDENVTR